MTRRAFQPHLYATHAVTMGGVASDSSLLYRWTGSHWAPIDEEDAERDAYAWLVAQDPAWASAENARRAVRAACLFSPRLPKLTQEVVVPTKSGYVHLEGTALVLKDADPGLGLTHCLDCAYEPLGEAPARFEQFLQRVLPDDAVRSRVQEYIGYTLLADARYQRAQFWLGEGANGKGVLANIVQALHGRIAAIALDQLAGFHLSVLVGASLVYVDEVPRKPIDEQRLKSMIAGERIPVDRKYREPLSIHVRGKWLVLGNHLPAITDHSSGFWRRWDVVPFSVTIPERERDPLLAQNVVRDELAGVLRWALDGLVRLLGRGGFDPVMPPAMQAMLQEAKADTNSVVAWLNDRGIALQVVCDTVKDRVFEDYRRWCAVNAMREVSVVQFWKRMHEHYPQLDEARIRLDGEQRRVCNVVLAAPIA
ncbi:putative Phage/plasmid primase P4, C-terminal [Thiomonas sp. X19]|uniref:DNA primase family protein n=1 Tax=Thiomonas sp. X19 TaxID=1050370 RepID=UPI000B65AC01|nr:phage/plasmid primase, P4 family [Thiomonas sp. X19]SCC90981.1 putative Phage/plasmid primase P4, C-terminal [Thiomonas sp. X19]